MELRQYWGIFRRYWWLILSLPLLAGLFTVLTYEEPALTYGYELQYSVSFVPSTEGNFEQDPVLSAVQASEYIADDLTEIFGGTTFATYLQQYMDEPPPAGAIASVVRSSQVHRLVDVSLTAPTEEQAAELGRAFVQATENDLEALLDELWGTGEIRLELVDESGPFVTGGTLRSRLDVPLRVALALVAAIGLAFLLDYLDDTIRSRKEVEQLIGPTLAEIPPER